MPIFEIGALDAYTLEPTSSTIEAPSLEHLECLNLSYQEADSSALYYEWAFEVQKPHPKWHEVRPDAEWQQLAADYGHCVGI